MGQYDRLGRIGIWNSAWSRAACGEGLTWTPAYEEAAAEVEALGYGAVWLGSSPGVEAAEPVLKATERLTVATGILNIWNHDAADVAARRAAVERAHPGRFLLGLGVSHSRAVERYAKPYSAMRDYLTGLDEAPEPVPADRRVLAALGPKMLELSRDRAGGAHPYLVTPEHTAKARAILGDGPLLAPEVKVVLDTDLDAARGKAREHLAMYLALSNYTSNLLRSGFTEEDLAGGGSDRLVDAVFVLGDEAAVAARAAEFLAAGADHLAVQVINGDPARPLPLEEWRRLAPALITG
ncbi:probable F420-dependent oxidoreductase, MSMEG_4141 family [Actinacidiphila alni]|uniref:Probable F420-dependent oxidoreductase, MSMEG_4141 family n=1 Tax=Actinacidiphila alni TaxID=380248 RepID=A0A1I1XLA3_9ACTN|nr:LLM class F420-dependent oxidoreductase [Actinacidiphila alni]SFE08082.1 probable F420-dependent oxidoreductase, MSMEG_4141 family [Actinacidiphila alni]